jgi:uncharacterized protein YciI
MFIISSRYTKPLSEVDALLEAHKEFLKKHYSLGHFIASGRKIPRSGGVILVKCSDRAELDRIIAEDPFTIGGVAEYEITEFAASMTAEGLEFIREG